jgi:hypothetical protein
MTTTTATKPTVESYKMTARNGRHIRFASMVTFADGRVIKFMELLSHREAIRQAERTVAREATRMTADEVLHAGSDVSWCSCSSCVELRTRRFAE